MEILLLLVCGLLLLVCGLLLPLLWTTTTTVDYYYYYYLSVDYYYHYCGLLLLLLLELRQGANTFWNCGAGRVPSLMYSTVVLRSLKDFLLLDKWLTFYMVVVVGGHFTVLSRQFLQVALYTLSQKSFRAKS